MRLIDTHAHVGLDQFDGDRAAVLARAGEAGVARQIEIGFDLPSSQAAVALAEREPEIYAAVGWQPHYAAEVGAAELAAIADLARHPKVVAIGEIGLDYHWDRAPRASQERLFREQLALARELRLPVVIHSRDAAADTVRVLRDAARGQPGVMHSFSGDWAFAEACLEVGFMLSFSGPITFPKALALHETARLAPLQMILSETDSPYLAPHPLRGRRNEPANVRLVVERLAALREAALADVAEALWANACRLFGLPGEVSPGAPS